ncbi:MAG: dTMP kinase [Dehalococcoidia bacterium]|nr:dTMP kinase [Dehalococcoidia bacterium]
MGATLGKFVAFEGGEGAGKSTQIALIQTLARDAGLDVVTAREPGGTPFGESLREALLHGRPASAPAELLAFSAARAELVEAVLTPALSRGALVLCDRFSGSTVAYQQYGRGLDAALVARAIELATDGLTPDLNVLLDLAPAAGLERAGAPSDRFEREGLAFHERVRAGFLAQAAAEPDRWVVLDATLAPEALARETFETIRLLR